MENSGKNQYSTGPLHAAPELSMDNAAAQMRQYKEEEKNHIAPKQLKLNLQQSAITQIGDTVKSMMDFRSDIVNASNRSPNINKKVTDDILKVIDEINVLLTIDLPNQLDKLAV